MTLHCMTTGRRDQEAAYFHLNGPPNPTADAENSPRRPSSTGRAPASGAAS